MYRFFRLLLALAAVFVFADPSHAFVVDIGEPKGACGNTIVVLDPGHGGEDTGAIGPGGVKEKDVTLALAEKLAAMLRDEGGCQVLLTRTDDTFVPLEDRTSFANGHRADIFVSIHANSTPSPAVKGIETYFLSFDATDDDARRVAAFENQITAGGEAARVAELAGDDVFGDLKDILLDLASTEAHHESSHLAELVHTTVVDATGKANRGVKQAPFVVLTGATMPAVLIEVGFISNPAEERWLATAGPQERIADSIKKGLLGFARVYGGGRDYVGLNDRQSRVQE